MITAGSIIKSSSALNGSYFENTSILIVEKNADGAIGFVMNMPSGHSLHELVEFSYSKPFPLFKGGPVDEEHIYVLHRRPDLINDSTPLSNGMYYGGSFQQVLHAININGISHDDLQLFLGYCGWDAGELEMEIEEGSWYIESETLSI